MFEEIIEFDQEKIEANNYDIDKINAYLDELHDVKEIRKKAEGHYSCKREGLYCKAKEKWLYESASYC